MNRTEQETLLAAADRYLALADRYAMTMGPPLLLVVGGLPGTGKSSLAARIAESLGIELLQTDLVRRDLFGINQEMIGYGEERYSPEPRQAVYDEMFHRAAMLLDNGLSVILDGTFLSAALRRQAVSLAAQRDAECLVIQCACPDKVALQRIADRLDGGDSPSEARPEFFAAQRLQAEPDSAEIPHIVVDTTDAFPAMEEAIFTRLRAGLFRH